jgi:hypothetical protein
MREGRLRHAAEALRGLEAAFAAEDGGERLHRRGFEIEEASDAGGVLQDDLIAQVDEHLGNIDLDRADLVARAAERGGEGQALRVMHLLKLRREDGADGAGVDGAVGVAAGLAIDGAGVLAGSAANAVEGFATAGVGEDLGACVIH